MPYNKCDFERRSSTYCHPKRARPSKSASLTLSCGLVNPPPRQVVATDRDMEPLFKDALLRQSSSLGPDHINTIETILHFGTADCEVEYYGIGMSPLHQCFGMSDRV
ncbi:Aste57867_14608 [Aphanomyces stellatus]|uniref:Aste57867_14608 protein n=1 Tax=Aphanomyces stellatus TaxID=120398 RepID=A0A485L3S1_9STRA|nr:hypothetical protein As57867_014554 [Aphanomyces stellatus]VFT91427.1 Aste57867_14608 [Aphanomyces stellatus]